MGIGRVALIDMNRSHLPFVISLIIILSSAPIAYAVFLTPVEIIDNTGDGLGNTLLSGRAVATDSPGNVFVAGASGNVFKITPGGTITEIIDATGDGTNALGAPNGVATDLSGNVFVSGENTNNAFKISTPGTCSTGGTPCTITQIIDGPGDGLGNTLGTPFGVATDSSGNVFVAGRSSSNAFKISTPGTCSTGGTPCTITQIIDSTGDGTNALSSGRGVGTDSSGNVFVTGQSSDNVFKISTPGTCSTGGTPCTITEIIDFFGDGLGNNLNTPQLIATDSSGNVFVTGQTSDNAFKISTPGTCSTGGTLCTRTEIIDSTGDGGGNVLDRSRGVATDSSGNVFVAGVNSDTVFEITPGGTITEIIDSTGDGLGNTLDAPSSVATDSWGNVFVTGQASSNAFKLVVDDVVGATLIPIDTTALLVAGFNASSIWMIPAVLGMVGAGIAVYKLKRK